MNKTVYDEMIKRNIDKLALVRISVVVSYDQKANKLNFSDLKIERLYTEDEVSRIIDEKCGELERKIEKIRSIIGSI